MGIDKVKNGLYHLDNSSFNPNKITSFITYKTFIFLSCNTLMSHKPDVNSHVLNESIWHQRLGHVSMSRMKMLPFLSHDLHYNTVTYALNPNKPEHVFLRKDLLQNMHFN